VQNDIASFSAASGRKISKTAIFIASGIIVAILLAFSYRRTLKSSDQDIPNPVVNIPQGRLQALPLHRRQGNEMGPFLKLDKVTQFGRGLELIGRAEAGSRLFVDDESVEVSGDGSFKHFTKQFPASITRVQLKLRATDLAGRTQTLMAYHDFSAGVQ
jgi:hypothetical protein